MFEYQQHTFDRKDKAKKQKLKSYQTRIGVIQVQWKCLTEALKVGFYITLKRPVWKRPLWQQNCIIIKIMLLLAGTYFVPSSFSWNTFLNFTCVCFEHCDLMSNELPGRVQPYTLFLACSTFQKAWAKTQTSGDLAMLLWPTTCFDRFIGTAPNNTNNGGAKRHIQIIRGFKERQ